MAKRLTDVGARNQRPNPGKRLELGDSLVPGLYLLVQKTGKKSWAVRARVHGRTFKYTIGPLSAWKVDEARAEARRVLGMAARGVRPIDERRRAQADTVEAAVKEWLAKDQAKNRGHGEVKRVFDSLVLPRWKDRPISSITRADVREITGEIERRGKVVRARRVHQMVRRFLQWCAEQELTPGNVMVGMPKPGGKHFEKPRERALSDAELAAVWRAAGDWPFGPAARLLILTCARREEISRLRWGEVRGGEIVLEGDRTKNEQPKVIPLSGAARELLAELPRVGREGFVFGSFLKGWSKAKARIDGASGVADWRIHDLRRTVASGLQRLGIPIEVAAAVLAHSAKSIAPTPVTSVYARYDYAAEKREALESWAAHLREICARGDDQS